MKNIILEEKKKLLLKLILIVVLLIIGIANFIKNKFEEDNYENIYKNLEVNNNVLDEKYEENTIKIYITGSVNNPGVIELKEGDRIADAIELAGGVKDDANLKDVNLAYCLQDGQKIYIPNINENEVEYLTTENGEKVIEKASNSNSSKININTSGVEELKKLSGVGEALAQRIITYREENGKFKTIDDLKNVSGIGEKKFESIKEYITVK